MAELIVGAVAATGLLLFMQFARKRQLAVAWRQWGLTVLAFLYSIFVLKVVAAFLREVTCIWTGRLRKVPEARGRI